MSTPLLILIAALSIVSIVIIVAVEVRRARSRIRQELAREAWLSLAAGNRAQAVEKYHQLADLELGTAWAAKVENKHEKEGGE